MLFLFPLLGINGRLRQAKEDLLIQAGDNIRMVNEQINSAAQKKDFSKIEKVRAIIFEDWGDATTSNFFLDRGFVVDRLDGNNSLARRD